MTNQDIKQLEKENQFLIGQYWRLNDTDIVEKVIGVYVNELKNGEFVLNISLGPYIDKIEKRNNINVYIKEIEFYLFKDNYSYIFH